MRRFGVMLLLALGLVLLGAPSVVHAQCTSPQSAEAAANATAVAEAAEWPLPVPRNARIRSLEDFRGVLLLAGSVYQIEEVVWQISPAGSLDILELTAYTREGTRTRFAKRQGRGRRVESLADLAEFNLGNPRGGGRLYAVDSIGFGTDAHGFLTVVELAGVERRSQEAVVYAEAAGAECGLRITMGCDGSQCRGGACGAAPGCPCNGTSGACSGHSETVCSGSCPEGMVCNGSVADCKCIPKVKPTEAEPLPQDGEL